jgi:CxxC-x17-CxxC domain-containing protein
MEQHHDEHIDCADCGAPFVFSAAEALVFTERGLSAPKRCKDCRRARKERAASGGQGGHQRPVHPGAAPYAGARANGNSHEGSGRWSGREARGPAPRYGAPTPRYTGDVNEYRSPMQDGFSPPAYGAAPRAPAPWQGSSGYRGPRTEGVFRQGRDGGPRAPRGSGYDGGSAPRPVVHDAGRRPGRDGNQRSVHDGAGVTTGAMSPSPRSGQISPRSRAPSEPAVNFGDGPPVATAGAEQAPQGHAEGRPSRRRSPAEMFSITCDACGAQAEVPFKPADGREVYCPTCYRARRPST